jgi:hypothetical protein
VTATAPSGKPLVLCSNPIPPVVVDVCNGGINSNNQCN